MADHEDNADSHALNEENLKRAYQKTVEKDIPDRFRDLLYRLAYVGRNGRPDTGADR